MYSHQGYNYVGIPAFVDYAHIKKHYNDVAPIRGRTEETRPLGRRRYSWYEIVENTIVTDLSPENPLGSFTKSYACKLYRTNVVEWYPNGDIALRVNTWKGPTTMGMLVYSIAKHGTVVSASGKWYFRNLQGQEFVMPTGKGDELLLSADAQGIYRPSITKQEYKYKAKRKELNKKRKVYEDFIEYTRTMLAMDNNVNTDKGREIYEALGFTSQRLLGNEWGNASANRSLLLQKVIHAQAVNDLEAMYKLGQYCAYAFGTHSYRGGFKCEPAHFVRGFTEVLKYAYHNEVFEVVEQPQGIAFHDSNAKYVSQ